MTQNGALVLALLSIGLLASGCVSFSGDDAGSSGAQYVLNAEGGDGWEVAASGGDVKPYGDSDGKRARLYFRKRGGKVPGTARGTFQDPEKVLPAEVKAQVQEYLDYFTGRGRKHVQRWLNRSTRYVPMMKRTFMEHGLPPDLVYVSMIESGFNPFAVSRARAVGMWQFIAGTGRRYNLKINSYVDERRDPVKATRAAAQYLRDLYDMFDSWDLALASYNAGEGKIGKGVRRYSTDNFWEIRKTSYLKNETKDYVPKYLAALMIAKNPRKYGFSLTERQGPLRYEIATVRGGISLGSAAKLCSVSPEEMRQLNPELRRSITPPGGSYTLRIPAGSGEKARTKLAALKASSTQVASNGSHRIRPGDTLGRIARRYGVSTRALARANDLRITDILRTGMSLRIPGSSRQASQETGRAGT